MRIKNILLIWPENPANCVLSRGLTLCEPLGLEYIAAALDKKGCNVDLLDMRFDKDINHTLNNSSYDIVGIAYPFTSFVKKSNDIAKIVKGVNRDIITVIGGHHPTVSLKYIDLKYVNYIIGGEGCEPIQHLYDKLSKNKENIFLEHQNIIKVNNGTPEKIHPVNWNYDRNVLNTMQCPMRSKMDKYREKFFHSHYKPISLVRFSVGCPYTCNFCVLWRVYGRKYLTRTNDSILNEILAVRNKYIYVVDDEAFLKRKKMYQLAKEIISLGVNKKFYMYVRADTISNNPKLIEKWAEAGLTSVLVGFETVNDTDLHLYNKGTSLKINFEACNILQSNGIDVRANFIVHPHFSENDFFQLSKSVSDFKIDLPTFTVLTPFFGTLVYDKWKSELVLDNPEFFDAYHSFIKPKLGYYKFYTKFASLFENASSRNDKGDRVFYYGSGKELKTMIKKISKGYTHHVVD